MIKRWWFSLFLVLVYLGTFRLWTGMPRSAVVASGLLVAALSGTMAVGVAKRGYFRNRWDGLIHAVVIADILLEALFVPTHEQHGFYLCALGFAVVGVAYRGWLNRVKNAPSPPSPAPGDA